MNTDLNKELATLASKLGTTVEHLWQVLIRQAYIDGVSSLLTVLICVALAPAAIYGFFYLRRQSAKIPPEERWKSFLPPFPVDAVLLGFALFALLMIAGNNLYWVITDFLNPEFYALRHLPFQ